MKPWLLSAVLLAGNATAAQDDYWLGTARGPYATGTHSDMWIDEDRPEATTSDSADKRRVMVQIWYPANADAQEAYAPYVANPRLFQAYVQEWSKDFASAPTRSRLNAPVHADAPFPVLLYSHGGNSPYFTGTAQTEFLASHGYIVVSVAHTDDSALVRFADGWNYQPNPVQQMPTEQERALWSELEIYRWQKEHLQEMHGWHVADLRFALDVLTEWNGDTDNMFFERLDLERVGALGWSRGGATSFQASVDDPRILAAVNLDGTLFGRGIETSGSTRPLLLVESTDSYFDPLNDREADPELEALWSSVESDWWGMFDRSSGDWYRAKIVGSTHTQFSDFPLADGEPEDEAIAPQRTRDITNEVLLEFFGKYLKAAANTPLLSGARAYPELRIITAKAE